MERQHRIDQQRFYDRLRMFSLEDGKKQLAGMSVGKAPPVLIDGVLMDCEPTNLINAF